MTIAGKINTLVFTLAVVAGTVFSAYVISREYSARINQIRHYSSAEVQSQPHLQVDIYYSNNKPLRKTLEELVVDPAILYAIVRDALGTILEIKNKNSFV